MLEKVRVFVFEFIKVLSKLLVIVVKVVISKFQVDLFLFFGGILVLIVLILFIVFGENVSKKIKLSSKLLDFKVVKGDCISEVYD